jgi:H+/gluconate symporter-like permease|tara:strand:- start:863 stop:1042 length:180 start_codon:yes stop_codon:yes gene_type:complete
MVEFFLGLFLGIILSLFGAMIWGYQLGKKEDELNKQLIKEFQDKAIETHDKRFYKRYES